MEINTTEKVEHRHLVAPPQQYGNGGMIIHPIIIPDNPQLVLGIGGLVEDMTKTRLGRHLTDLALEGFVAIGVPTGTATVNEDDINIEFNLLETTEVVSDAFTKIERYNGNHDGIAVIASSIGTLPLYELIAAEQFGYNIPVKLSRIALISPFLGGKHYPKSEERAKLEYAIRNSIDPVPITTPHDTAYGRRRLLALEGVKELQYADVMHTIKQGFTNGVPELLIIRGENDNKVSIDSMKKFCTFHPGHTFKIVKEQGHNISPELYEKELYKFIQGK